MQPFFMRIEQDYHYFFLNISNDEDIEGLQKVVEIYPERNKLLWKNTYVNLWMKATMGHLSNLLEAKELDYDVIMESLTIPPDEDKDNKFLELYLPFEPKVHKKLIAKEFSDATVVMDL